MTKIGIISEGKTPPDKRVPLTPAQCAEIARKYPNLEIVVQPSPIRAFPDSDYSDLGIALQEDLSDCDLIMGVKEVPIDMLIPKKTYMFFSHTFKEQPYNRPLLRAILEKKISLIDYEVLTTDSGTRIIGFGRYAGIVGCYNAFMAYGAKSGRYSLKPAHECFDRKEVEAELKKVSLPDDFRLALTGNGRVAHGALEILSLLDIKKVTPAAYLKQGFESPVFTQLKVQDYNAKPDGSAFTNSEFYEHPERFVSNFMRFARCTDVYIPCHYWDHDAPFIFTREDAKSPDFRIQLIADISCDIDGPVASTIRPSTIADPLYGYDPQTESEVDFMDPKAIGVMAVDNLPCELPRDASEDFGRELVKNVLPELLREEKSSVIARARQTDLHGNLTETFSYLKDYVDGV
jgi:hypothetical protein